MTGNNQIIDDPSAFTRHDTSQPIIIKAVGVGGGGNNAVNYMYREGIPCVSFANINSDRNALRHSDVPVTLEIGDGLGAGNKPEKARTFAEDAVDEISRLFDDDTKMVFITAGMGGGTGTGAGPVVARIAKERGLLTIGIVTIPFLFEGQVKIRKAIEGADLMAKYVDALLVINNERLTEIYGDLDFDSAFDKADDTLAMATRSISDIITQYGSINLDFNDIDTTLRDGGAAIISTGYGEGPGRVTAAIQDALRSPLLKNRDILGSKKLLFCIYYNPKAEDPFRMSEAAELTEFTNSLNREVDVIWGRKHDETLQNQIKITILASGFEISLNDDEGMPEAVKTGRPAPTTAPTAATAARTTTPAVAPHIPTPPPHTPAPTSATPQTTTSPTPTLNEKIEQRLVDEYGQEKISSLTSGKERSSAIILGVNQLDDDAICAILEKYPAYKRPRAIIDSVRSGAYDTPQRTPAPNTSGGTTFTYN